MKKTSLFLILLAIISLSVSHSVLSQKIEVILKVNTTDITDSTIAENCRFKDQPPGVSLEDFTTDANKGDKIKWRGESTSNADDKVKIKLVKYKSGTNVLGKDEINGRKEVNATVENGTRGDTLKYILEFEVHKKDPKTKEKFPIDPKIRIP